MTCFLVERTASRTHPLALIWRPWRRATASPAPSTGVVPGGTGRVLSKPQITEHVWGYDSEATSNVVEIYIHYLRDKVDRGFGRPLIRTIRGVGYTIRE